MRARDDDLGAETVISIKLALEAVWDVIGKQGLVPIEHTSSIRGALALRINESAIDGERDVARLQEAAISFLIQLSQLTVRQASLPTGKARNTRTPLAGRLSREAVRLPPRVSNPKFTHNR